MIIIITKALRPAVVIIFATLFLGCRGNVANNTSKETKRAFENVEVPVLITDPLQRAEYAVAHYWDKFDFTDTTYIHLPEVTEQAFADYIGILMYVSPETAAPSIKSMLKKAEADRKIYDYFTGLYEKYLYEPNSPMRNDELYIPVLEAILESSVPDDTHKIRPAHLLELTRKNRVGSKAADFAYTRADGTSSRMSALKADYLIIYFYNPDCENCKEYTRMLSSSPLIQDLLKKGTVKILAVYPDENIEEWRLHLGQMPSDWVIGYDKDIKIENDELYDLKAIPMLYLLDKDKNVILKDTPYEALMDYLMTLAE